MKNFFHARANKSLLKVCTKFRGKVTRIKGVTDRKRPHICKLYHVLPSLMLWFRSNTNNLWETFVQGKKTVVFKNIRPNNLITLK